MCHAQGLHTVPPMRLEPAKLSTTEPLCKMKICVTSDSGTHHTGVPLFFGCAYTTI